MCSSDHMLYFQLLQLCSGCSPLCVLVLADTSEVSHVQADKSGSISVEKLATTIKVGFHL